MPNFRVHELLECDFPLRVDFATFKWKAVCKDEILIYTSTAHEDFFLLIKKRENEYLVKSDKTSKPTDLNVLQKALLEFRDNFTKNIIMSAINNAPKMNFCSEYLLKINEFDKLNEKIKDKQVFLEIGFGSGRHLLYQAKQNPKTLIVGIEIHKPSISQVINLIKLSKLENVIILDIDARLVLSLLQNSSLDKVFLHFPVPWNKAQNRRVVSDKFAQNIQRVLKKGGSFELRSDDKEYTDFTISTFLGLKNAKLEIFKDNFLEVSSKYEDRWVRQNKNIYDVIFTNEITLYEDSVLGDFTFHELNLSNINPNLNTKTIKGDDYFVHIQRIYIKDNGEKLLKVAFGAFYKPVETYILIQNDIAKYLFHEPLKTIENLNAHEALREYLSCQVS